MDGNPRSDEAHQKSVQEEIKICNRKVSKKLKGLYTKTKVTI